jgi:leucyl/phenylalanyl-tRNA--protein transferase
MIRIPILRDGVTEPFPPVESALDEPNGLLAAGGDLSPQRLLDAYRHGIFPWFSEGEPILWWSPNPRTVFATDKVHISIKLHRWLKRCGWTIRADTAFAEVMRACAAPRAGQPGTWITRAMFDAYRELHALGHAHSIEIFDGETLAGGIYGIAIGRMFFGESMFSRATNGSKVALIALCRGLHDWGFPLLDAQAASPHLASMGAFEISRAEFTTRISNACAEPGVMGSWRAKWSLMTASDLA